ncbi:MAG: hypothetical protein IJN03_03170, partial [Bacilli bacterium]|nr:hypothetical protein [Bacilli bacterium]
FGSPFMVSGQFHFNGFLPNMLYFFISISIFLRRLYLVTPTFIIEPLFVVVGKPTSILDEGGFFFYS